MTQPVQPSIQVYNILENLRKHLKLRVEDMLQIIGISRPAYYGWAGGRKINSINTKKVNTAVRNLMAVAKHPEWKQWDTVHLTIQKRREILDDILARLASPAAPQ